MIERQSEVMNKSSCLPQRSLFIYAAKFAPFFMCNDAVESCI
jgi:hypothetical protein